MNTPAAGRYRIDGPLGAGGMGVIYRAYDPSLDRDVALKFLTDDTAKDETARLRLLREARTAATLNHPNILTVHEVGEADGRLYIAMELVLGESLQRRIPTGGLAPSTVIGYGIQIADALAHAHANGVVHRDLKSANVMVTNDGHVKVLDFGIARRGQPQTNSADPLRGGGYSGHGPTLTGEGIVLGTPHYLPPEVLQGRTADGRSDLWSLGVLLHEMVAGKMPFAGGSVNDLVLAITHSEPEPLPGSIPQGLRSVIMHCLAKDPARRYQYASEVRAALEAVRLSATAIGAAEFGTPAGRRSPRAGRWTLAALAAVVLAVVFALRGGGRFGNSAVAGDAANIRSLAVLPLANLSGDPAQDYFADGMTEELITRLASIDSLKVISRTSVMQYRGTAKSITEIAKELGVDGIIEGSVIRAGDRVKITAQLIDAAQDKHLWAESYERNMMDVLALQSEVARDIAARVRLNLSAAQRARMAGQRIKNPQAYENYLQGRAAWNQANEPSMRAALGYFDRAIALDSTDARSYAGMADAFLVMTQVLAALPFAEGLPLVRRYADRALVLDPGLAEANTSKAISQIWVDRDWSGAEQSLRRAYEINPGYSPAYVVHATLLNILGRQDESVTRNRRAVELDPHSTIARYALAWQLLGAKHYDQALSETAAIQRMDPAHVAVNTVICRLHELRGDYKKAVEMSAVDPGWVGSPPPTEALRRGLAKGGKRGYWQAYVGAALRAPGARRSLAWHAYAELQLGNREEAIHWLRQSHAAHEGDLLFLRQSPLYQSLHGDPRFDSLLVANRLEPVGSAAGISRP
ncbi:MAG: protein kinase [Candidatus Eisenbacteria bacterium]